MMLPEALPMDNEDHIGDYASDLDVRDPETAQYGYRELHFSHETMVARAYMKVQDALAVEMVQGHNVEITDNKGNSKIVYQKDTREVAVEAVLALKNTMIADITKTPFEKTIDLTFAALDAQFKRFLDAQRAWIASMKNEERATTYAHYPDLYRCLTFHTLHPDCPFGQQWMQYRIGAYRKIFEQLELCLAEGRYFQKKKLIN